MRGKLGFYSILLLSINSIIGSGIFLSPGSVLGMVGIYTPLVYVLAALFATLLSIVFAAAACYVNKSGSAYAYTRVAFGKNVGFYVGITRFIAASIAWGVMATGVVKTVLSILGLDRNSFSAITMGFILLMFVLLLINIFGFKFFSIINVFSTIGKLSVLILVVFLGVVSIFRSGNNHFMEIESLVPMSELGVNIELLVMATIVAFYAFTGFESVASGASDMQHPERNLPKAIPLSLIIVCVIYLGILLVAMMLNPIMMIETDEVVALSVLFPEPWIKRMILYGALISMLGINVAASFHTPRILEAMAQEGDMPLVLVHRSRGNFPLRAFCITIIIAMIFPLAFRYNMTSILILSAISRFLQYLLVPLAVIFFYYGKNVEPTLANTDKNLIRDFYIPLLAIGLTIFLLIKFNWVEHFSLKDEEGVLRPNNTAIAAMILGYVLFPVGIFIALKQRKKRTVG